MPTLLEIMAALADQLRTELDNVEELTVYPTLAANPTPPAIDIYPGDSFQERLGFGAGNNLLQFVVRARVNTPDHEGAQETLLGLCDPHADTSVAQAVESDGSLGGLVNDARIIEGPSQYGIYGTPSNAGLLLGCTWTVSVMP
jgi:hypothetical protein